MSIEKACKVCNNREEVCKKPVITMFKACFLQTFYILFVYFKRGDADFTDISRTFTHTFIFLFTVLFHKINFEGITKVKEILKMENEGDENGKI